MTVSLTSTDVLPRRYGDGRGGHGLSLLVKPTTHGGFSKSWAQRIRLDGKAANVGLGAYRVVTLARARQKALPHAQISEALARVRASRAHRATAFAFEFLVLTACRSGEVRGARWAEVDEAAATWTVPPARMKAKLEHRLPHPDAFSGVSLEIDGDHAAGFASP